ncbi:myosin-9-like isoform X2 [Ornithodoros turicata]|uniref:myosin-9-like isoform X2 n=1 Tax=Ornithodoros turicata TaxID=34597 RepID=UPI003139C772
MSQQHRVYGKPLAVIESSQTPFVNSSQTTQSFLMSHQHDSNPKAHRGNAQQASTFIENMENSKDKPAQELTSSAYFTEVGTNKMGGQEFVPEPTSKQSFMTIDEDYTSVHKAWVSLETELRLKKMELQQALELLSEKERTLNILKSECDFAKAELHRKKSQQLKTEAILVGLQDKNVQYKKHLDEIFNLVMQCYELRDKMFENNMASNEEFENLTKTAKQLSEMYDENIRKLDTHNSVLHAQLLKMQKEMDAKEAELNSKISFLQDMSKRYSVLENHAAETAAQRDKMEQETCKLRQNLQLLLEEHSKTIQEKENIQADYQEAQGRHASLMHNLEEMRNHLENIIPHQDEDVCSKTNPESRQIDPVSAIQRGIGFLIHQCRAMDGKLQEAIDAIKELENEKEVLDNEKQALIEKMATFESLLLEKQNLEQELADDKLKIVNLMEDHSNDKEEYKINLKKVQVALQDLVAEKQQIVEDFTEQMNGLKNGTEMLDSCLRSVIATNSELQQDLEALKAEKDQLSGRVDELVTDLQARENMSLSLEERISELSETIARLENVHADDLCKLEASRKEIEGLKKSAAEETETASAKAEALTSQLEQKTKDVDELNEKLKGSDILLSELKEEASASRAELEKLKFEIEGYQNNIQDLTTCLEQERCRPEMHSQAVHMSQTDESERNKELQAALKETKDKLAELEIDFNRLRFQTSEQSARFEKECREYGTQLEQATSKYNRLERKFSDIKVEDANKEKQIQSLTKQLHNVKLTENLRRSDIEKGHKAEIEKLEDEKLDLQERLEELLKNLDAATLDVEELKYELEKIQKEQKSCEAKFTEELTKKQVYIDNLTKQHMCDAIHYEEEIGSLTSLQKAKQNSCNERVYKSEYVEQPGQCAPARKAAPQHTPAQAPRVQPVASQPQQTPQRRAPQRPQQPQAQKPKRTLQREVHPVQPVQSMMQTRRKEFLPSEVDYLFDSDSSVDNTDVAKAVSDALRATPKQNRRSGASPQTTFTTVKGGMSNMPPPAPSPQPKKRKFFKSQNERSGTNNFCMK